MKKRGISFGTFLIILVLSFVYAGTITINLGVPENNSIAYSNPVKFNASVSTDASSLLNISLWTNVTGSWAVRNTSTISQSETINDNNVSMSSFANSASAKYWACQELW